MDAYDKKRDDELDFPPDDWEQREWDDARYEGMALPTESDGGESLVSIRSLTTR